MYQYYHGDFKNTEDIYFGILYKESSVIEETGATYEKEVSVYSTKLNKDSSFYKYIDSSGEFWFEIPTSEYSSILEKSKQYIFRVQYDYEDETQHVDTYATWGGLTDEDIEKNEQLEETKKQTQKIEEQTNAIKEQTEVSKNIFQRIGDILSYINPLSENFFAYKLIDLLIDALKSLFIPEERFSWRIF